MTDEFKKANRHSDTWCPVPFTAISLHPTGTLTRCMMSEEIMSNEENMDWDSPDFQALRKSMLEGKWDEPGCDNCKKKEEMGVKSQRQNWLVANHKKKFNFTADEAFSNPQLTGNTLRHMFLNFNNVCNFKCRMCSPRYSNSLIPEWKAVSKDIEKVKFEPELYKNVNNVLDFIDNNKHRLQDLTSIWITGGEPFIDNQIWKAMDILNEYADPSQIHMTITTNGSKTSIADIDKFRHFKQIHWDLSTDVASPMFEYMRSNGVWTWEQMNKHIQDLSDYHKENEDWLMVSLNSSYQLYNATSLNEFFIYVRDMFEGRGNINNRILVGPNWFQARHAPDSIKAVANKEIRKLFESGWLNDMQEGMVRDAQRALNNPAIPEQWNTFVQQCKAQDKFRGINLMDYDPLLGKEVYEWKT